MLKLLGSRLAIATMALSAIVAIPASATPSLVVDTTTGKVLQNEDASRPWYPASLTKLMTTYVALKAVREGRVTLDTPFVVSARAARMPPSKMAFKPGSEITLDNALKILMVKSANDVAVTVAEGVAGSVEDFATLMNHEAARLGMRDSHFVNPHGLHDNRHVSSARDMALIGMALLNDFPEQTDLYGIGALRLGKRIIPTHNGMLGRYPGADGMKTGFTCAAGFNVVATATQGGRRLMVVILGAPNARSRTIRAMGLLENGFSAITWGRPSLSGLPHLSAVAAPNMRPAVCGKNRKAGADEDFPIPIATGGPAGAPGEENSASFFAADNRQTQKVPASMLALAARPAFTPVEIFVGRKPGYAGPVAAARGAPATAGPTVASKPKAKAKAKPVARKPARKPASTTARAKPVKPANAVTRPVAASAKAKAKAKPGASARKPTSTKPASAKPGKKANAGAPLQIIANQGRPAAR